MRPHMATAPTCHMTPLDRQPDHDPIAGHQATSVEHDTYDEDVAVERERERRATPRSERLKITRRSTEDGELITVAFRHRPPTTSQTSTLIPGEVTAELTYHDPEAALNDACEFVTAALAACRAETKARNRGVTTDRPLTNEELARRLGMKLEAVMMADYSIGAKEQRWERQQPSRLWVRVA
jgi:hypothetical protein